MSIDGTKNIFISALFYILKDALKYPILTLDRMATYHLAYFVYGQFHQWSFYYFNHNHVRVFIQYKLQEVLSIPFED